MMQTTEPHQRQQDRNRKERTGGTNTFQQTLPAAGVPAAWFAQKEMEGGKLLQRSQIQFSWSNQFTGDARGGMCDV